MSFIQATRLPHIVRIERSRELIENVNREETECSGLEIVNY